MLDILQIVGAVGVVLVVLYFVLGIGGNLVGAAIGLLILIAAGPPAKIARLRRQNIRMREQARVSRGTPANLLGERREPAWMLRPANLRLRGEMEGLSLEVPNDRPDEHYPATRSERFCDWIDAYEHMFVVGVTVTFCLLAAAAISVLA